MVNAFKNAIKKLWLGRCTVSVNQNATDATTGRTVQTRSDTVINEPCRISFNSVTIPENADNAAKLEQSITLYISNDVSIPEGSKITVTQSNTTKSYERSGTPAVYTYHQEVPLKLCERWV